MTSHDKVRLRLEWAQAIAKEYTNPGSAAPDVRHPLVIALVQELGAQERHDEKWALHAPTDADITEKGDDDVTYKDS